MGLPSRRVAALALVLAACDVATPAFDAGSANDAAPRGDAATDVPDLGDASSDPAWTAVPGISADCVQRAQHPERVAQVRWEACASDYPASCARVAVDGAPAARWDVRALAFDRNHDRGILRLTSDGGIEAVATTDGRVHVALVRHTCAVDVGASDGRVIVAISERAGSTPASRAIVAFVGAPEDVLDHPMSSAGLDLSGDAYVTSVDATVDLAWVSLSSLDVFAWRGVDPGAPPERLLGRPLATAGGALFYAPTVSRGTFDDHEVWARAASGTDARVLASSTPVEGFGASDVSLVHVASGRSVTTPPFAADVLSATPFATDEARASWTAVMDFVPGDFRQSAVGRGVLAVIRPDPVTPYRRQILDTFDLATREHRQVALEGTSPSEEGIGWISDDAITVPLTRGGVTRVHRIGRDALAP